MSARKVWKMLNEGIIGYVFYIFLGIVAALIVTNVLGLVLDTSIPLVAVVSGSMDHGINEDGYPCEKEIQGFQENFENWWMLCDSTYDDFGITEQQFLQFSLKDGLKRGDMVVIQNSGGVEIGDVIVYNIPSQDVPIIHRVVALNEDGTYQTKGDHNREQNAYESSVQKSVVRGKAVLVLPYLGYLRAIIPIN